MHNRNGLKVAKRALKAFETFGLLALYKRVVYPIVNKLFFMQLVLETGNFSDLTWLGKPIWQNILDLWVIQETVFEVKPNLLIETGTNKGGSAFFYAQMFDLMGKGKVVSIDIEKMHNLTHPRIEFIVGHSTSDYVLGKVRDIASSVGGPVMVILDSDHSRDHVSSELEEYARFVTPNSYLLVQDGVIDILPIFRFDRPGPLAAIRSFIQRHSEFEVDIERGGRFLITHHPSGWLRKR